MRIIYLICMLILLVAGCRVIGITPFGLALDGPPKVTKAPRPTEQLWNTVKKSNWTITLAIPIIALGAVAAFNGMIKLGMSAIIFGSVNLFMGLATARFAIWMAVFGLLGSVAAVVASVLMKNRALREIVIGGQLFKKNGTSSEEWKDFKKAQEKAQKSVSTKKLVQDIKTKLKLNGGK